MLRFILPLLLALPFALHAEKRQFGNVIYDVPQGWMVGAVRDGYQVLLSDMPDDLCEFCYIYIGTGSPGAWDPVTYLTTQRYSFVDPEDRSSVEVIQMPEAGQVGPLETAMMGTKVDGDLQILIAVALKDRTEIIGFQGQAYDEADFQESMAVFAETVTPFLASLTFPSEGAANLLPEPVSGPLSGIWWGYLGVWNMNLDLTMSYAVNYRTLVFWPDGHFYDGTPPDGLKPIDRAALLAAKDADFGTYTLGPNGLYLTYADGRTDEISGGPDSFAYGDSGLFKVEPLADGTMIDGGLDSFFYSGFTPGSGVNGGMYSASYQYFHPDGTWESSSSGGASASLESGGETTGGITTNSGEITNRGTYVVKDGLLIQTARNGEVSKALIYRALDDIMIGEMTLKP
jgi:hypothetical protein